MKVRVKICCIKSVDEAKLAIASGASAVGLVSAMPSGPGVIEEERITAIAQTVPPPVATFLLTSEVSPDRIVAQQRRCGTNTLQLCDHLTPEVHRELRAALPGIGLVQVVQVEGEASIDYAVSVAPYVDALLLDSGSLSGPVKQMGGTGRTHDWNLSRQIRERVPVPVFLAGGLTDENVARAIAAVRPFGVDLCSSVRTEGRLDEDKLSRFFRAAGNAASTFDVSS